MALYAPIFPSFQAIDCTEVFRMSAQALSAMRADDLVHIVALSSPAAEPAPSAAGRRSQAPR